MFDLFLCLDMNSEHINKAFDNVCTLMDDLNMCEESDILPSVLGEELKRHNPFNKPCPTEEVIRLLYDVTEKFIKKKYPDAETFRTIDGYRSSFKVDNTTYEKGLAERREAYYE